MTFDEALRLVLQEEEDCLTGASKNKINVYGSEGKYPHLHYKIDGVEGCIRLDIPRYFCHEPWHEGLNSAQKKILFSWLTEKNWKRCVEAWNKDSNQDKVLIKTMPDYGLLPNLKPNGKLAEKDRK